MAEGFKNKDGTFVPIHPAHAGILSESAKQSESSHDKEESGRKLSLGSLKILGRKAHGLAKDQHKKHKERQEAHEYTSQQIRSEIDLVIESHDRPMSKIHQIQSLMVHNRKHLNKNDYQLYNQRIKELYDQAKRPPAKGTSATPVRTEEHKHSWKVADPDNPIKGVPTRDEEALNRLIRERRNVQEGQTGKSDISANDEAEINALLA